MTLKITPMLTQYLSIKKEHPDAVLFYRMGDFYEMFFEDAEIASRILEITLTSRNKNDNVPVPMCGVPYRAAKGYIARLIENGMKVAVCDQVEDPAQAKGLVRREVVRVVTPGMILEDEFLDERTNNFILSLCCIEDIVGISSLDVSTGGFRLTESKNQAMIVDEMQRISPSEILLPDVPENHLFVSVILKKFPETFIGRLEGDAFEYERSRKKLLDHFKTLSLEGFGCEGLKAGVGAAGALLQYVRQTQKQDLAHLKGIETYFLDRFLLVDENSCRNLELVQNLRSGSRQGTLLNIMDRSVTAMGGRLMKNWLRYPLVEGPLIESRLDAVTEAVAAMPVTRDIRDCLKSVHDLSRLSGKIAMGHSNARDMLALERSLEILPLIKTLLGNFSSALYAWKIDIEPLNELKEFLRCSIREDAPAVINEGGMIKPGFNPELDELIDISGNAKGWLARMETEQKLATGINSLKVRYNKVFGYYIEIPRTHSNSVPETFVRKQTLVNAERYITEELKEFETKALSAEDRRMTLEYAIFNEIRERVMAHNRSIQETAEFIAVVDCLLALAETADRNDYHRPRITTDGRIMIEDGRHPVIEKMIEGERFVPNSIVMDNEENQVLMITGPNMAGKSTILRQVALTVLMAQMGSFVPAKKASIGIIDRIFTRVGALDNLSAGQSTFMVEMQETAGILNCATRHSLVIMDEIGRGTSTFDGLSIAWAVAAYLHDLHGCGVKTLFATHYHQLTDLSRVRKRVKNFHVAVKEWNDEIIFLRKLAEGGTSRSYGIQVARLAGIPDPVIRHAKKVLYRIENEEHVTNDIEFPKTGKPGSNRHQVQLSLFNKPESVILDALKTIDISQMTPMDAMNCLNDIVEKTKSLQ